MKAKFQGIRRLAAGAISAAAGVMFGVQALAEEVVGQPTDGAMGLQPGASELKYDAIAFHNFILLPIITVITLFVLALLIWCMVRYNKRANPVPATWSHNTVIEVIWTAVPVLILMVIAIFSFKLLYKYHDTPTVDLTIKAVGRQWNWDYEYPDQKITITASSVLPEADAMARGVPYRLAATEPLVVPVNKVVRVLVTAEDVIHSFALPAFGLKTDAVPGRVNETWFRADRVGTYYGQCSELCGRDHAFMPIEIKVVTQAEYNAWVASKAPPAPAAVAAPAAAAPAAAAPAPAAAPAAPAAAPAAPAAPAPAAAPAR
ncbi:MAG: cytochrome c oxidase subunit II [Caulobacteraceae bacterium]